MDDAHKINSSLVTAPDLLRILFAPSGRPSVRWLRTQQKAKVIPSYRIGRLVFFNPDEVRDSLAKQLRVNVRT